MFKRSLSEEWLAQARQVSETQKARRQNMFSLYCPCCRKYTFHNLDAQCTWEHYFCEKCGNQQSYRVG